MRKNYLAMGITLMVGAAVMTGCAGKQSNKSEETTTVAATETTTEETTVEETTTQKKNDVEKVVALEYEKEYKIDFDGDGTEETIEINHPGDGDDYKVDVQLNGKVVCSYDDYFDNFRIYVVDMNTADNERELVVFDNGASVDPTTRIFRYADNDFKVVECKLGGYIHFYGDNVVTISTRSDYQVGTGYNVEEVYTYEDGEFTNALDYAMYDTNYISSESSESEKVSATDVDGIIAELEKNNADTYDKQSRTFYAAKDLELCDYDAASQNFTKKDTVAQYTAFTVSRFSGEISCKKEMTINGVYITTEDGKEGWIQLPEEYDFNDLTEITEEEWKKAVPDFDEEFYPIFSNGIMFPIYLAD